MRLCRSCQAELVRRVMPKGHLEYTGNFRNRTFCDKQCRSAFDLHKTMDIAPYPHMARQLWNRDLQL